VKMTTDILRQLDKLRAQPAKTERRELVAV